MKIKEIEKLLDGTTEGEWEADSCNRVYNKSERRIACCDGHRPHFIDKEDKANAAFIAASKGIVKQLLKERAAYREIALRNHLYRAHDCGNYSNLDCVDAEAQRLIEKGG